MAALYGWPQTTLSLAMTLIDHKWQEHAINTRLEGAWRVISPETNDERLLQPQCCVGLRHLKRELNPATPRVTTINRAFPTRPGRPGVTNVVTRGLF